MAASEHCPRGIAHGHKPLPQFCSPLYYQVPEPEGLEMTCLCHKGLAALLAVAGVGCLKQPLPWFPGGGDAEVDTDGLAALDGDVAQRATDRPIEGRSLDAPSDIPTSDLADIGDASGLDPDIEVVLPKECSEALLDGDSNAEHDIKCLPECQSKECGDDGCGGSCGNCAEDSECDVDGKCQYVPWCGNGACQNGEDCETCPVDCGVCCGNGACDDGETKQSCPADCEAGCMPGESGGMKTEGQYGVVWMNIPAGCFVMGCSPGDTCGLQEKPPHEVVVSSFEMMETEVTEGQWAATVPGHPTPSCDIGGGGGGNSPVECVNWSEAKAFCETVDPKGRLCTEAEWEYAARAGTATKYYCGDDPGCLDGIAWFAANSGGHKHDVKSGGKQPNTYGLHDMLGNVWEWVEDCWHGDYDLNDDGQGDWKVGYPAWTENCGSSARVCRGGTFEYTGAGLRVSVRNALGPSGVGYYDVGFRCCKTLCAPDCQTKECGPDGCGGTCGKCPGGESCKQGKCVKNCGDGQCDTGEDKCNCPADCGACSGCCKGGECKAGISDGECGANAAACVACEFGKLCQDQTCASVLWKDPASNLTWQNPAQGNLMSWSDAPLYCSKLSLDGGGWHLPTIGEFRTLIRGCPATVAGGTCKVTDSCLSYGACWDQVLCSACQSAAGPAGGCYWPEEIQGSCGWYWSASAVQDLVVPPWGVNFLTGGVVFPGAGDTSKLVRCVR